MVITIIPKVNTSSPRGVLGNWAKQMFLQPPQTLKGKDEVAGGPNQWIADSWRGPPTKALLVSLVARVLKRDRVI